MLLMTRFINSHIQRLNKVTHTTAVISVLIIDIIENSKLSVSVIVSQIGSRVELIADMVYTFTFIGYNHSIESVVMKVSMVLINDSLRVGFSVDLLIRGTVNIIDIAEVIIQRGILGCIQSVNIFSVILEHILRRILTRGFLIMIYKAIVFLKIPSLPLLSFTRVLLLSSVFPFWNTSSIFWVLFIDSPLETRLLEST